MGRLDRARSSAAMSAAHGPAIVVWRCERGGRDRAKRRTSPSAHGCGVQRADSETSQRAVIVADRTNASCCEYVPRNECERISPLVVHRTLHDRNDPPGSPDVVPHGQSRTAIGEHEMHLVPGPPRIVERCGGKRREGARSVDSGRVYKPIDQFSLELKLLGIRDVLPRAAAAGTQARRRVDAEMAAARSNSMSRRSEDLDERRDRPASALDDADSNALAGYRERDAQPASAPGCDAVAVGRERVDVDDYVVRVGPSSDSGTDAQLTFRSSTSNTSVALGGMTPPAPWAP